MEASGIPPAKEMPNHKQRGKIDAHDWGDVQIFDGASFLWGTSSRDPKAFTAVLGRISCHDFFFFFFLNTVAFNLLKHIVVIYTGHASMVLKWQPRTCTLFCIMSHIDATSRPVL